MSRPILAQVNLTALRANLTRVRERAPGAQVLAVVKANAYGHGLARVLPALEAADGLALVELDAAIAPRTTRAGSCCSRASSRLAICPSSRPGGSRRLYTTKSRCACSSPRASRGRSRCSSRSTPG
jgi:hypothetical protein